MFGFLVSCVFLCVFVFEKVTNLCKFFVFKNSSRDRLLCRIPLTQSVVEVCVEVCAPVFFCFRSDCCMFGLLGLFMVIYGYLGLFMVIFSFFCSVHREYIGNTREHLEDL
jgi:hypothetical protein